MAILDTVKLAARIKHDSLNSEITRQIALARAEMIRAGVPSFVAESDTNELIVECIVQGTLKNISTDEKISLFLMRFIVSQATFSRKNHP